MRALQESWWQAIEDVAATVGTIAPYELAGLIDFETAGSWDPALAHPGGSARGLIGFTDATAQDLGYEDAIDLTSQHPEVAQQIRGPVRRYLERYAPVRDLRDLVGVVWYPALRHLPDQTLPPSVAAQNSGIDTIAEYARRVAGRVEAAREQYGRRGPLPELVGAAAGVPAWAWVAGLALVVLWWSRR